jgi:large subunit ribosomal protein L31
MKKNVHPKYGPVLFKDITSGDSWIGRSTKLDGPVEVVNGVECHVVSLEISSFSHPFYSGKSSFVDTAGRVERFKKRFGASTVISKKKAKAGAGESA